MAYDERLAERIRWLIDGEPGLTEKRMFGGLAFLVDGRMALAAGSRGALMLRVEPDGSEAMLDPPLVRRMVMRGKELAGWLDVDAAAVRGDDDLRRWVETGLAYARSLPAS